MHIQCIGTSNSIALSYQNVKRNYTKRLSYLTSSRDLCLLLNVELLLPDLCLCEYVSFGLCLLDALFDLDLGRIDEALFRLGRGEGGRSDIVSI